MSRVTVLGIDAAWTAHEPSGVALLVRESAGWRLVAAESSYDQFQARAEGRDLLPPAGSKPCAADLLAACANLTGQAPALIAVDMPLSRLPIVTRRASDNAISKVYGARKCGTHTPNEDRPGKISNVLRTDLESLGYPLWTVGRARAAGTPGLIEVYPHPALVELTKAEERLPYKVGKTKSYWKTLSLSQRREKLLAVWAHIVTKLAARVSGLETLLSDIPREGSLAALKSWEDKLDAVICGWVGACVLEGRAEAHGDADAAIWVPLRDRDGSEASRMG